MNKFKQGSRIYLIIRGQELWKSRGGKNLSKSKTDDAAGCFASTVWTSTFFIAMAPLHCFYTTLFLQVTFPRVKLSHHQIKLRVIHTYLVLTQYSWKWLNNMRGTCPYFSRWLQKMHLTATLQLTQIIFFHGAKHRGNVSLWYSFTAFITRDQPYWF